MSRIGKGKELRRGGCDLIREARHCLCCQTGSTLGSTPPARNITDLTTRKPSECVCVSVRVCVNVWMMGGGCGGGSCLFIYHPPSKFKFFVNYILPQREKLKAEQKQKSTERATKFSPSGWGFTTWRLLILPCMYYNHNMQLDSSLPSSVSPAASLAQRYCS